MFTKKQFLDSMRTETATIKHLATKIPHGTEGMQLGKGMRSTLELMRYLTYCGSLPVACCLENSWARAGDMVKESGAAEMTLAGFPAAMDRQMKALESLLAGVGETDLETRRATLPWGGEMSLGEALVNTSLKFMAAYRMQLFLHLKSAGVAPLDTFNCWLGRDRPKAN